ncbi:MAG: LacI family DNA-binding transcriptional regulator [Lachnospiraceae bacterium]|nr:LacI family DNA-binding transcriptional regulator [Lachnospiraceae bacterium]
MNLKDIAALAGVSTATVSNVLNGNTGKVSDQTRERVERIIRESDYQPNAMARSLAKRESHMIGLVIPYIGADENFLLNPYYSQMIAALEQYVRSKNYYVMFRCVPDCGEVIPLLSSWNVDGAFFLGVVEEDVAKIRQALHAPVVFLDTYTEEADAVTVGLDDYRGGYLAAKYLIGKGHRKIALTCPDYTTPGVVRERYLGFVKACEECGLTLDPSDIYRIDTNYQKAVSLGQDVVLANRGYTAVATMSDIVAMGIMEGIRQCGYSVPEDISVIGFDNLPESEYITPKLTTIAQDFDRKAQLAVESMFEMIENKDKKPGSSRIPVQLMERQTVREIRE